MEADSGGLHFFGGIQEILLLMAHGCPVRHALQIPVLPALSQAFPQDSMPRLVLLFRLSQGNLQF